MMNPRVSSLVCSLLMVAAAGAAQPGQRPLGDSAFVAPVPLPGYPEGIAVFGNRFYVAGPATFGIGAPSAVWEYDLKTGALVRTIPIQGQTLPVKAASCIAAGKGGDLFVVEEEQGIVRIDAQTGHQSVYAGPFYPVYSSVYNPAAPYLLNDLAFDKDGYLYVTDSFQATIWRVPPGGGAPIVWFQSPLVDGIFGPNGIRVDQKSQKLYFTVSLDGQGLGYLYSLPLVDMPSEADLSLVHTFNPGEVPDGIAIGKKDDIYVALAGYSQIVVLNEAGAEVARYMGPALRQDSQNPLPWANPANIAFDDSRKSLLVTNHASLTGLPDPSFLFAVFDVYVNDQAGKLFKNRD